MKENSCEKRKDIEKSVVNNERRTKKSGRQGRNVVSCYKDKSYERCKEQNVNCGRFLNEKSISVEDCPNETVLVNFQLNKLTMNHVLQMKSSNDDLVNLSSAYDPSVTSSSRSNRKKSKANNKYKDKKQDHIFHGIKEKNEIKKDEHRNQCYGPGCVNPCRSGSKYCSDNCGLKLATNRIYEILPHRIQQWRRAPSKAEENNIRMLEKIRREQQEIRVKLASLEQQYLELKELISVAKKTPVLFDQNFTDEDPEEAELNTYCITCGHAIPTKTALKHMERCFNKYESQILCGSFYQTNIEGSDIFCEVYNASQHTYCKRLKVLCPEHCKEPKVLDTEVCGCPLMENLFNPSGKFCNLPKKKCVKHYKWEKYRQAEIELTKMRLLFKLDDLIEQEHSVRQQMANRGGVLALMLHQTIINHS